MYHTGTERAAAVKFNCAVQPLIHLRPLSRYRGTLLNDITGVYLGIRGSLKDRLRCLLRRTLRLYALISVSHSRAASNAQLNYGRLIQNSQLNVLNYEGRWLFGSGSIQVAVNNNTVRFKNSITIKRTVQNIWRLLLDSPEA